MNGHIHLVLGGSRSGKSRYAEELAKNQNRPVLYIATCRTQGMDQEMKDRVNRHQLDRPENWLTLENRFDLAEIVKEYSDHCLLLDCLTLWMGNAMETMNDEKEISNHLDRACSEVRKQGSSLLVVSNELGMGLVPETPIGREFRDLCGRANQQIAAAADNVTFMVAGIPLQIKPQ